MSEDGLQRYQVMEPLGTGGQGTTFRGVDRRDGSQVAIKVLQLGRLEDWKGFDLFERECEVLASLHHPRIPRFIDRYASEASGDYFLVMELVEGRSLRRRMSDGERVSEVRLRAWFDQALDILEYLHSQRPPVIHRDIKPANFVCDQEGRIHLVDFGGVRIALSGEGGSTMIGTFGYMAPEQLHGEATAATDLFALAATFASLASGVEAESLPRAGLKIDIAGIAVGDLRAALEGMLEPDPTARLGSVAAVRQVLRGGATGRSKSRDDASTPTRRSRPPPSSSASDLRRIVRDASPRDRALARIPEGVRELAEVEHPLFRFLIWAFASVMTGALVVLEAVLLPIVFALFGGMARRNGRESELHEQRDETISSVVQGRESMSFLARRTQPFRND